MMKFNINTNFNIQSDINHENTDSYGTPVLLYLSEYNDKHIELLSRPQERCFESLAYFCKHNKCLLYDIKNIKTNSVLYFNTILFLTKIDVLKLVKLTLLSDIYGFPPNINYEFNIKHIIRDYTIIDKTGNLPYLDESGYINENHYFVEIDN